MKVQEDRLAPGLYIAATPIGNLEDLTFRALRAFREANFIAAEDTRETRKLLNAYGINTPLLSLHEHSGPQKIAEITEKLKSGQTIVYVSDAGTPGISDPGADLVAAAGAEGITIFPLPGASAPVALLSVSGFSGSKFSFHGFISRKASEQEEWLKAIAAEGGIHVFFESPHRVAGTFESLAKIAPQAQLVVGRELTKKFETISRGSVAAVTEKLSGEDPRGEYVLAISFPEEGAENDDESETLDLLKGLAEDGANHKVLTKVGISRGLSKNRAYEIGLQLLKK